MCVCGGGGGGGERAPVHIVLKLNGHHILCRPELAHFMLKFIHLSTDV